MRNRNRKGKSIKKNVNEKQEPHGIPLKIVSQELKLLLILFFAAGCPSNFLSISTMIIRNHMLLAYQSSLRSIV